MKYSCAKTWMLEQDWENFLDCTSGVNAERTPAEHLATSNDGFKHLPLDGEALLEPV